MAAGWVLIHDSGAADAGTNITIIWKGIALNTDDGLVPVWFRMNKYFGEVTLSTPMLLDGNRVASVVREVTPPVESGLKDGSEVESTEIDFPWQLVTTRRCSIRRRGTERIGQMCAASCASIPSGSTGRSAPDYAACFHRKHQTGCDRSKDADFARPSGRW